MQKISKVIGAAILTIVGVWGMIATLLSNVLIEWVLQRQFEKAMESNRSAMGIIGGADGPTAVFFIETPTTIGVKLLCMFIFAVCTVIGIMLLVRWGKNKGK